MSVRKPIQVPEELKESMDAMQAEFRAKTSYELIEKLIRYYRDNEAQKAIDFEKQQADKQKQLATMIYLGEDVKTGYMNFSREMGFRSEAAGVQLLIEHYENSPTMDKRTFDFYRQLKKDANN